MKNLEWEWEDRLYAPKRSVNNKSSKKIPHSKGLFYSNKMERTVEYESLAECLFYFMLELDPGTTRYYVQPVEIEIPFYNKERDLCSWPHIPDVLVFRSQKQPCLFQIKASRDDVSQIDHINKCCKRHADQQGWTYRVVYPKELTNDFRYNLNFLMSFTRKSPYYQEFIDEILDKLTFYQSIPIDELAASFRMKINPMFLLPVIYFLIGRGDIKADFHQKITTQSKISLADEVLTIGDFFLEEGNVDEV